MIIAVAFDYSIPRLGAPSQTRRLVLPPGGAEKGAKILSFRFESVQSLA
jgi:hypothetical protein